MILFTIYSSTLNKRTVTLSRIHLSLTDQHVNPISSERKSELQTLVLFALPPTVVSVCPVGFGHLVEFILLLDNVALLRKGCQQLLRQFLIHMRTSVFVVPALGDHPFHGEEASPILCERDGHLSGVGDQTEQDYNLLALTFIK